MAKSIAICVLLTTLVGNVSADLIRRDFIGEVIRVDSPEGHYSDAKVGDPVEGTYWYYDSIDDYAELDGGIHRFEPNRPPLPIVRFSGYEITPQHNEPFFDGMRPLDDGLEFWYGWQGTFDVSLKFDGDLDDLGEGVGRFNYRGFSGTGVTFTVVPEPSTWLMLAMALPLLFYRRR